VKVWFVVNGPVFLAHQLILMFSALKAPDGSAPVTDRPTPPGPACGAKFERGCGSGVCVGNGPCGT
ncbi:MAG: hypothetical protein O3B04_06455, partial [Chloroflexi bacterium]|nr:hypothetical protein [Chloroflexota bacterium]